MNYAYIRVSSVDQHPDRQIIAMQEHISIHAPAKGATKRVSLAGRMRWTSSRCS